MEHPKFKYEPLQPDCVYHIYNRANGSEKLFLCKENYHFFLRQYTLFIAPIANTLCYCLMPNHFHFLIRIKPEPDVTAFCEGMDRLKGLLKIKASGFDELFIPKSDRGPHGFTPEQLEKILSRQFASFFSSYTQAFNKTYLRMGSLFMKNFKRIRVTNTLYLRTLVQYIHMNPVQSSLCLQPGDWPFTSYSEVIANDNSLIKASEVIELFGDVRNFVHVHKNVPEPLEL